jgi:sulfide:quinone oxidoreductase
MEIKTLTAGLSVSPQVVAADMKAIKDAGFRALICNRPDGEGSDQPTFDEIAKAAKAQGLEAIYLPIVSGMVRDEGAAEFDATLTATKAAGYDMAGVVRRIINGGKTPTDTGDTSYEVVVVGAGAGGIAAAASLKARKPGLEIAIIDPADIHYYQPGWTMVGGGTFDAQSTACTMGSLIPKGVHWIKSAVAAFEPDNNAVILDGCRMVKYKRLIVCPGIKLDWNGIEGLVETLGHNGVTSNYRYDLAPYTWQLVEKMKQGRAIFTQPPMPIKCAGAPQKAMYLSGDAWHRRGVLKDIDIHFNNAGGVLFGVKDYVPARMEYVKKYDAHLNFFHTLVAVDGPAKKAWFDVAKPDTPVERIEMEFDMMHV